MSLLFHPFLMYYVRGYRRMGGEGGAYYDQKHELSGTRLPDHDPRVVVHKTDRSNLPMCIAQYKRATFQNR